MEPDEELLKKIEKFLGINLRQRYKTTKISKNKKFSKLTIGDIIEVK
jgi:ribosome-binding protein aMBF1 (putative translation factor)